MIESVVNISDGRDADVIAQLSSRCDAVLLDVHEDAVHDRSVFSLAGDEDDVYESCQSLARTALELIDIHSHQGPHPRLGSIDVVPFVPLSSSSPEAVVVERDRFATWAGTDLALPCFYYGPLPDGTLRYLPDVRRLAFSALPPDTGPTVAHPTAGACAVGARGHLVAYNIWLSRADITAARDIASKLRSSDVKSLAFDMGSTVQLSFNLTDPFTTGPTDVYDAASLLASERDLGIERSELVGLIPAALLARIPRHRWAELDVSPEQTIEARMQDRGIAER
ncbi:MAG: hypothetical protein M1134_02825 [Actinobacteria bacterium]|nr:hypothetical protein [Actinomycetota bacterium]